MSATPTIETRGLTRAFEGRLAVEDLSLSIDAGEVVALLGPNGAGKTTTVRLLNGVLRPDRGSSRVLGLDPATQGDQLRRRTGVMTETSGLDDRLTAVENVTTYARIRGLSRVDAERETMILLERFGMAEHAQRRVAVLSTGQRKRVALARSLLHRPEVLFLDEPTSGLDPAATREVIDAMAALAREEGRTIVLCTHFLTEASRLCRKVAILEHGRLVAFGAPTELAASLWPGTTLDIDLGAPAAPETLAALRRSDDVISGESTGHGVRLRMRDHHGVPRVVSLLVGAGCSVYGVIPWTPTLEDVYFALTGDDALAVGEPPGHPSALIAP